MPCGCQGSTYTPPGFKDAATQQGDAQNQPEARLVGPASEGYYHGPAPHAQPQLQDAK